MARVPDLVFVSGLSGAGKSVALDMLEDLDYFCIDNLPLALAASLNPEELGRRDKRYRRIAVGIDARASLEDVRAFPAYVERVRAENPSYELRVIFLTAAGQLDVTMGEVIHVGAREWNDIRGAQPLGAKTVLFTGARDDDKGANSADAVCERMTDLPDIVARLAPE